MDAITLNKTVDKILNSADALASRKALDYYDGKQLTHMIELLNSPSKGRRNWKSRGYIPLYRNLTKSVVERSGMLFNHGTPTVAIYDVGAEEPNELVSALITDYMENADFTEFLINCDDAVRLLKTVHVLTDYDSTTDAFYFNLLHSGNSWVEYESGMNTPSRITYIKDITDDVVSLRVITSEVYEDWQVEMTALASNKGTYMGERLSQVENPYGMIPVVAWHDTHTPRNGRKNHPDFDLVNLNEALNLFYTDINYAGAWSLRKTLFTNASFGDTGAVESYTPNEMEVYRAKLPSMTTETAAVAGPDQAVVVDTRGIDSPFIDYKGPDFNMTQLVELWKFMIQGVSSDWSVNIEFAGDNTATSGFQLLVQEIPNAELRQKRQRMASSAIQRIVDTMIKMHNQIYGATYVGQVFIDFPDYTLPMDAGSLDDLWFKRIENMVATREDYLVNVLKLSAEEAQLKLQEIDTTKA